MLNRLFKLKKMNIFTSAVIVFDSKCGHDKSKILNQNDNKAPLVERVLTVQTFLGANLKKIYGEKPWIVQ